MKKQILNEEFLKMQKLAGIITEAQYKQKLNENMFYVYDKEGLEEPIGPFNLNQANIEKKKLGAGYDIMDEKTAKETYTYLGDNYELVKQEFDNSPNNASYDQVLDVINSFEGAGDEEEIKSDFISRFSDSPSISKKEYMNFLSQFYGEEIDSQMNWISMFDPSIYDRINS